MSACDSSASASTRASIAACAAPLEPRGYIGWAASPASVTRPKVQASIIGYSKMSSESRINLRRVQPVETPAFIERQKVQQLTRPIPIVLLEGVALDVGHPIDELVALPIDVINDRVDDHLTGQYRAGAYLGTAVEDWLSPRHPAPAVDAGKGQLVVWVILFADRRIDAVSSDHDVCVHALAHTAT